MDGLRNNLSVLQKSSIFAPEMKLNYKDKLKHPVFKVTRDIVTEEGLESDVIGGSDRDLLLDRPSKYIDIVVVGNGLELAESVAKKLRVKEVSRFKFFGTALYN